MAAPLARRPCRRPQLHQSRARPCLQRHVLTSRRSPLETVTRFRATGCSKYCIRIGFSLQWVSQGSRRCVEPAGRPGLTAVASAPETEPVRAVTAAGHANSDGLLSERKRVHPRLPSGRTGPATGETTRRRADPRVRVRCYRWLSSHRRETYGPTAFPMGERPEDRSLRWPGVGRSNLGASNGRSSGGLK